MPDAALKNKETVSPEGFTSVVTPYHAKYYAHELTAKKSSDMVDRLTYSLVEAAVDLNPHQIEAALFALRSPLSKGVILADEVGLGKTIEAGLLLCQFWAEHKRRLLIICPASLRRQWSIELEEKFGIPSIILENKSYTQMEKDGQDPLMQDRAIIMSYHFAARLKDQMPGINWDLVVIDEAHKLRNLYKKDNKMGKTIYEALGDKRKVLLTATPLQNSLMELFGLAMLVDDRIFGSEEAFKDSYVNGRTNLSELQNRLKPFVHRTLRKDVLEYIKYTNREAITVPFTPNEKEQQLYELISDFVLRQDCYSIPTAQRKLVVLVIRKLLSSSTYAIIGTLKTIKKRLLDMQAGQAAQDNMAGQISHENELGAEYEEEAEALPPKPKILDQDIDEEKLRREIAEIDHYIEIARSIKVETKAVKLLHALETGFKRMQELGAQDKAIIFTESNRTQRYIKEYLEKNPEYKGKIVTFNGQNNDDLARSIYQQWLAENEDTGRITGARDVDMRQALVDHFKNHARVMIATEAAAEGMNLQFCSLLVNYDLPWNPQRVEQRIGRCHRYGQKHDVVVINFLNEKNWADQRIYELLRYKFKLFDGVFGASDEVLGRIEDGIDFEKRISDIFDTCRTPEEIESAFENLQTEMEEPITEKMSEARKVLFEHFDEDVHSRLRLHKEQAIARRDEMLDAFWHLTKYILIHHHASQFIGQYHFDDERRMFGTLRAEIEGGRALDDIKLGASFAYRLGDFNEPDEHALSQFMTKAERKAHKLQPRVYKPSTDLGKKVIDAAKALDTAETHLTFDYTGYDKKISVLESLIGKTGWLIVSELSTKSFEENTQLVFAACDEEGNLVPDDIVRKFFKLRADEDDAYQPCPFADSLEGHHQSLIDERINKSDLKAHDHFNEELDKLDRWAEDLKNGLEMELKKLDQEIREITRQSKQIVSLEDKLALQKKKASLEKRRSQKRHDLFTAQDDIDKKRDELITDIEKQLKSQHNIEEIFRIQWRIV